MTPGEPDFEAPDNAPVAILVVDDRSDNRAAMRAILSSPGYRLVEAASGTEALRALLDGDFALVLADVRMPGMSGFELVSMIRQRDKTASLPVILVTGEDASPEFLRESYRIGAADYLVKPLVPEVVTGKVAVFAELWRQRQRLRLQSSLLLEAQRRDGELRMIELRLSSERRYRGLADAVPHVVWTAGLDGTLDYVNQRWYELTGLASERVAGKWDAPCHPEDLPRCEAAWSEANRTGGPLKLEVRVRAADGSWRWQLARAVPERNVGGALVGWIGTFTDVEDRKRAEEGLVELKGTLDAVLDAVTIFEPEGWRFLYVNEGASALLGYGRDELLRLLPYELMPDYGRDRFRELLAPLLAGEQRRKALETRWRRKDGSEVPVELSLQYIRIDGGRIASIARDVTERRQAELEREMLYGEALEAVRARDEFLSIASHELRTPLSSLKLQLELLLRPQAKGGLQSLNADQLRAKLRAADRQVDRLARLVSELMDVSRITAGRLSLELEPIDLAVLAGDVIARLSDDFARTGSKVTLVAPGPAIGRWDRLRTEQVVTNLLANALKFGEGKPIEVAVSVDGPTARLEVTDHGIGIAPDKLPRIFERFERAVPARAYGGLGLGLYIVRQIVQSHGGTVRVDSRPEGGTRFTVELPVEPPAEVGAVPGNGHEAPRAQDHPDH